MFSNTRLLVFFSVLAILTGLSLLFSGSAPNILNVGSSPSPKPSLLKGEPDLGSTNFETEDTSLQVTEVIDGDTIEIEGDVKIRLLGIDTPETRNPRRPVGCFGKEASNVTKGLLEGKRVILEKDVSETDKYGRLLRYVYLPLEGDQSLFVNDYLVREGFALALTYPPDVKYNEQLREAEREARIGRRGLWEKCK